MSLNSDAKLLEPFAARLLNRLLRRGPFRGRQGNLGQELAPGNLSTPPAKICRSRLSLFRSGGGKEGIVRVMTPAQRYMAAAAIVFVVGGRIYSDRKQAQAKAWSRDPTIETLVLEGNSAIKEARFADSSACYQKALALTDKDKDPNNWAGIATAVAFGHGRLGDWKEAEILLTEALRLTEKHYGPQARETSSILTNLAKVLKEMNRPAEAEPFLLRLLAIDEVTFGKNSPMIVQRLDDLARLLQSTNRLAATEPLIRRALAINETSPGEKSRLIVAKNLKDLAHLLKETNRPAEAEPFESRRLEIMIAHYHAKAQSYTLNDATNQFITLRVKMGDTEAKAREKIGRILRPLQGN